MWVQRQPMVIVMVMTMTMGAIGADGDCGPMMSGGQASGGRYVVSVHGGQEGVRQYTPDQRYVVTLTGSQSFTDFSLWLQPPEPAVRPAPARVGQFQLFADSQTQFSDRCISQVESADDLPKTEVQVLWKAPPAGAGCVLIKAMVYENASRWFADDAQLTKRMCEDKAASASHCCACDDAKYQVLFEGLWSPETHPKQFPTQALWLTHFSDVIVASHVANFSFWGEGQIASDGFRSLAEGGAAGPLEAELRLRGAGGSLRALSRAAGLWHPRLTGNTSTAITVDRHRHLVSVAAMFGPSPDWVVGVSGLELCLADCTWQSSTVVELQPYDAGTDSGITYMSPNMETRPRERMYHITPMYPEDPRSPFYHPGGSIAPLARLTFTRVQLQHRPCDHEILAQLANDISATGDSDNSQATDPLGGSPSAGANERSTTVTGDAGQSEVDCVVSPWGPWSQCSVSCGVGHQTRTRSVLKAAGEGGAPCPTRLSRRRRCSRPC